ncbi:deoxyribonuclease V [Coralloluteibacterium thermophilus]|uniref:Endonuclease V n=1 Tax=Coralloluteibacterium thermophilum TaxID=2707049 RepID=A0ABV9NFV6_9GAMM
MGCSPPMKRYETHPALAGWDGTIRDARRLQVDLAARVALETPPGPALRTLAGFDVGFEDGGSITRAAAVLLDADSLQPLAEALVRVPTRMPYVPGLLSFRELPALVEALGRLPAVPDLAFVDGHGIAHPRRLGIAAHFGVATGLPCIGVAKSILCGDHGPLRDEPGAHVPLEHEGEQIGWVLRSKRACRPLVVSPGHRVSMRDALDRVVRALTRYRLPEPTRLADRLASRRAATAD